MPRGPQILSSQQRSLLESARIAALKYDQAEAEARAEFEALLDRRVRPLKIAKARAVRDAVNQGVPKSRVNLEVLGTTTPNAYAHWLNLAEEYDANPGMVPAAVEVHAPTMDPRYTEARPEVDVSDYWPLPAGLAHHEHAPHFTFIGNPADRRFAITWSGYPSTAPDAPDMLMGQVQYAPHTPSKWLAIDDPQNKATPYGVETGALTFEAEIRRGQVPLREALEDFIAAAQLPPFEAGEDAADEGF